MLIACYFYDDPRVFVSIAIAVAVAVMVATTAIIHVSVSALWHRATFASLHLQVFWAPWCPVRRLCLHRSDRRRSGRPAKRNCYYMTTCLSLELSHDFNSLENCEQAHQKISPPLKHVEKKPYYRIQILWAIPRHLQKANRLHFFSISYCKQPKNLNEAKGEAISSKCRPTEKTVKLKLNFVRCDIRNRLSLVAEGERRAVTFRGREISAWYFGAACVDFFWMFDSFVMFD